MSPGGLLGGVMMATTSRSTPWKGSSLSMQESAVDLGEQAFWHIFQRPVFVGVDLPSFDRYDWDLLRQCTAADSGGVGHSWLQPSPHGQTQAAQQPLRHQ